MRTKPDEMYTKHQHNTRVVHAQAGPTQGYCSEMIGLWSEDNIENVFVWCQVYSIYPSRETKTLFAQRMQEKVNKPQGSISFLNP